GVVLAFLNDDSVLNNSNNINILDEIVNSLGMPIVNYRLERAHVDISMDQMDKLKQHFLQSTGQRCSAFEIVAASFWSCRTRAVTSNNNMLELGATKDEEEMVKFVFFANCRRLLEPPLPKGFYGNCFFPVTMTESREWVARASLVEVVKVIQEAKAKLPEEFGKYRKGDAEEDPFMPPLSYNTLFVSEWGRLGFNQVDLGGWGPPLHIVPIQCSPSHYTCWDRGMAACLGAQERHPLDDLVGPQLPSPTLPSPHHATLFINKHS
ncbi:Transferase, partial [Trema orientale]